MIENILSILLVASLLYLIDWIRTSRAFYQGFSAGRDYEGESQHRRIVFVSRTKAHWQGNGRN